MWSAASVVSEWVYSEARRSHDRGALVQLRERDVDIDSVPAPFDAVHCPYVDDTEALLRSVAARVDGAAPVPGPPSPAPTRTLTLLHAHSNDPELPARLAERAAGAGGNPFRVDGARAAATFGTPVDAVRAAYALAETEVAVGIHTGTPTRFEDGFIGMDAQRAARIGAAAAPGQVLVSGSAAALLVDAADVDLVDLGSHRFDGLPRPERLFQAGRPGAQPSFPAVRSLGSVAGLPRQATSFVGRASDLDDVTEAVTGPDARLVTLVGAGGMGKTRLALAVAERVAPSFPDGVYFVPLETATNADDAWGALALALAASGEDEASETVRRALGHSRVLLVLDNLEQLADAGSVVADLLAGCPSVRVLATSRRPVHIAGEQELLLQPLDVDSDAIALFGRQAALVRRGFVVDDGNREDVRAICRALDGLPLAIELAAARLRLLSPSALRARLGDALDVSTGDSTRPDRQRTLRQTIEWSHELLDDDQRTVFRRLGVFPAGAGLDAAEALAGPLDVVESLAELSLVHVVDDEDSQPRIMLLNTTRAFAAEQLKAAGEEDAAYADLVRWCAAQPDPGRDHVVAGLEWLLGDAGRMRADLVEPALGLTSRFVRDAVVSDHARFRLWLRQALAAARDTGAATLARAQALRLHAYEETFEDATAAAEVVTEARAVYDALDDAVRGSDAGRDLGVLLREVEALALWWGGDAAAATEALTTTLAGDVSPALRLDLTNTLGRVRAGVGDTDGALQLEVELARLARAAGHLPLALLSEMNSACSLRELGRPDEALAVMESAVPAFLVESPLPRLLPVAAEDYAAILVDLGRAADAALLWGAAQGARERYDLPAESAQAEETAAVGDLGRARLGDRWEELVADGRDLDLEDTLRDVVGGPTNLTA